MKIPAGKIIAKTIGTAALGLVCYDAYKQGKWQGKMDFKNGTADMMIRINEDSQLLDRHTATGAAAKNKFNRWFIESGIAAFCSGAFGFLKGITDSILNNAVPFALAIGALCFKKCDKLCAIGLGLYALKFFIYDMLGIGKPHYLKDTSC